MAITLLPTEAADQPIPAGRVLRASVVGDRRSACPSSITLAAPRPVCRAFDKKGKVTPREAKVPRHRRQGSRRPAKEGRSCRCGGLGKPMTREDLMKMIGWNASDLRLANRLSLDRQSSRRDGRGNRRSEQGSAPQRESRPPLRPQAAHKSRQTGPHGALDGVGAQFRGSHISRPSSVWPAAIPYLPSYRTFHHTGAAPTE